MKPQVLAHDVGKDPSSEEAKDDSIRKQSEARKTEKEANKESRVESKKKLSVADEHEAEKTSEFVPQFKPKVKCAAVNDDEDFGDLDFLAKSHDSETRKASNAATVESDAAEREASAPEEKAPAKKEKEFAWMDSEDEGLVETAKDEVKQDEDIDEEKEEEVSVEILDNIQSFGRMILLQPSLQKWLRAERSPGDVVAVCRALARTKFFDGDMFSDIYSAIQKLLRLDKFDVSQATEAIMSFRVLNAYDRSVFSAIARTFRPKVRSIEPLVRKDWLEIFQSFSHKGEDDFLQMLEALPILPNTPGYRRIRCPHHAKGSCVLDSSCTYSHDPRAPLSLAEGLNEDWWRNKPLVMTQCQKTMGRGIYGIHNESDSRAPPVAPAGWLMVPGMHGTPAAAHAGSGVVVPPPAASGPVVVPPPAIPPAIQQALDGFSQQAL